MDTLLNMFLGSYENEGIIEQLNAILSSMDSILLNLQTQIIYIKETMSVLFYLNIGVAIVSTISLVCIIAILVKLQKLK